MKPVAVAVALLIPVLALVLVAPAQGDSLATTDGKPRELTLRIDHLAATDSALVVDLVAEHVIDQETAHGLVEGIPATLIYEIEVWRDRPGWFDHFEGGRLLVFKVQRDAWDEVYVVRDSQGRTLGLPNLDAVREMLEHQVGVAVAPIVELSPDHDYYLIIKVALKPLTAEDVDELEGWLAGEVEPSEHSFGLLTLP
ncbi:MAG TPA: DUF4390 domain-containing protein, partial [Candidatus Udaeobacter sp.]|nr:DUF4390 domain-containing protein [Candidatus Udaeobacter sp.]